MPTFEHGAYTLRWTPGDDTPIRVFRGVKENGEPKKVVEIGYGSGYVTWNRSNHWKKDRHAPAIRAALESLYQERLAHYGPLTRFHNWPRNELDATELD